MSFDPDATFDAIVSHALATGLFGRVNQHEPESVPRTGLTAAVWAQTIVPIALASGLAATSARVTFMLRIYTSMLQEPADAIDPDMLRAASVLMAAYTGDFELGGTARNIDLLGASGVLLGAVAGYIGQDDKRSRVMDITVPVIFNDCWTQSP